MAPLRRRHHPNLGGAETIRAPSAGADHCPPDPTRPDESVLEPGKIGNNLRNLAILWHSSP